MKHSVELEQATVFDVTIAKQNPFLYMIYGIFENQATLYVGQTRGPTGALGRLAQHLSDTDWNTYLQRLSYFFPYEEVPLERIDLVAVRFTHQKEFYSDSREYREAVEGLVQRKLLNWLDEHKLEISIVSRTSTNAYSSLSYIQKEADRISGALESWIEELGSKEDGASDIQKHLDLLLSEIEDEDEIDETEDSSEEQ